MTTLTTLFPVPANVLPKTPRSERWFQAIIPPCRPATAASWTRIHQWGATRGRSTRLLAATTWNQQLDPNVPKYHLDIPMLLGINRFKCHWRMFHFFCLGLFWTHLIVFARCAFFDPLLLDIPKPGHPNSPEELDFTPECRKSFPACARL